MPKPAKIGHYPKSNPQSITKQVAPRECKTKYQSSQGHVPDTINPRGEVTANFIKAGAMTGLGTFTRMPLQDHFSNLNCNMGTIKFNKVRKANIGEYVDP
jgi:hypothetical protein